MIQLVPVTRFVKIPGGVSDVHLMAGNGRRIVVVSKTRQVWLVEVDSSVRTAQVVRTPVEIDPKTRPDLYASYDLSRLMITARETVPRVVELPSGRQIYPKSEGVWQTLPEWRYSGRGLTPDGRYVIEMDDGQTRLRDLNGMGELGPAFTDWHECEQAAWRAAGRALRTAGLPLQPLVVLDHVDDPLTHPVPLGRRGLPAGAFYLVAPCYGFVVSHVAAVTQGPAGPVGVRVSGRTRTGPAPVYDPSRVVPPFGRRHALAIDQFSCGVTALYPVSGRSQTFPREPEEKWWYGDIHRVVPCRDAPMALVQTQNGACLWHLDGRVPARTPIADPIPDVVALFSDSLLAVGPSGLAWLEWQPQF